MSQRDKNDERLTPRPSPGERERRPDRDEAKPLAEEVEEEMEDQDIPVETGIRPSKNQR